MADSPLPWKLPLSPEGYIPEDIRKMIMDGFLTSFEDFEAYEKLVLMIVEDVQPRGQIEWLWVKDVTDSTWDIFRARRAKAACLAMGRKDAIRALRKAYVGDRLMASIASLEDGEDEVNDIFMSLEHGSEPKGYDGEGLHSFSIMLERFSLTENSLQDIAYNNNLTKMEAFDRLIDNATARRDSVLREVDRRREVGRRMRQAVQAVDEAIDAEFE